MTQRHSPSEWEDIGRHAILDFLQDRFVAPWSEIEARIAVRGWKDYDKVQPLHIRVFLTPRDYRHRSRYALRSPGT